MLDDSFFRESSITCGLCTRQFGLDDGDGECDGVCGDCKFLLSEDHGCINKRTLRRRRSGSSSNHPWPNDTPGSSSQNSDYGSSESGSMRWNIIFSDTDIDTLSDWSTITSPSARSDYSDQHSFLNSLPIPSSDSDSDIDPMQAYYQWNSEGQDEEEEDYRVLPSVHISWTAASLSGTDGSDRQVQGPHYMGGFEEMEGRVVIDKVVAFGVDSECVICREGFNEGEEVDKLPCSHLYHPACISEWLRTHNSCPICRYELTVDGGGGAVYEDGESGRGQGMSGRDGSWRRRMRLLLAAAVAPILSISAMGIVIGLSLKRWPKGGGFRRAEKKRGVLGLWWCY